MEQEAQNNDAFKKRIFESAKRIVFWKLKKNLHKQSASPNPTSVRIGKQTFKAVFYPFGARAHRHRPWEKDLATAKEKTPRLGEAGALVISSASRMAQALCSLMNPIASPTV